MANSMEAQGRKIDQMLKKKAKTAKEDKSKKRNSQEVEKIQSKRNRRDNGSGKPNDRSSHAVIGRDSDALIKQSKAN